MQVPLCALPTRGKTSAPSTRQATRRSAEYERLSLMLEEYNPSLHQQFVTHAGPVMTRTGLKGSDKKALQSFLKAVAADADVHPADKKAIQQFFKSGLSTGAKIGIGVGSAVALAALAVIAARNGISRGMSGVLNVVGRADSHERGATAPFKSPHLGGSGMAVAQSPHTPARPSSHPKANDSVGAPSGGGAGSAAGAPSGAGGGFDGLGDAFTGGRDEIIEFVETGLASSPVVGTVRPKNWHELHAIYGRSPTRFVVEVVPELFSFASDLNKVDKDGYTLLQHACRHGHSFIAGKLLDGGADVTVLAPYSWTSLHMACVSGCLTIAERLLDTGKLDINAPTEHGLTPLHIAYSNNTNGSHDAIISLLTQRGGNLTAKNKAGETPEVFAQRVKSNARTSYTYLSCLAGAESRVASRVAPRSSAGAGAGPSSAMAGAGAGGGTLTPSESSHLGGSKMAEVESPHTPAGQAVDIWGDARTSAAMAGAGSGAGSGAAPVESLTRALQRTRVRLAVLAWLSTSHFAAEMDALTVKPGVEAQPDVYEPGFAIDARFKEAADIINRHDLNGKDASVICRILEPFFTARGYKVDTVFSSLGQNDVLYCTKALPSNEQVDDLANSFCLKFAHNVATRIRMSYRLSKHLSDNYESDRKRLNARAIRDGQGFYLRGAHEKGFIPVMPVKSYGIRARDGRLIEAQELVFARAGMIKYRGKYAKTKEVIEQLIVADRLLRTYDLHCGNVGFDQGNTVVKLFDLENRDPLGMPDPAHHFLTRLANDFTSTPDDKEYIKWRLSHLAK
jgi:hypothetical protein